MYINPDGATTRTAAETAGRGPVFDQALSTVTAASALMWVTSRIVTPTNRDYRNKQGGDLPLAN